MSAQAQIPAGWKQEWSAQYRTAFYVNIYTNESTWVLPTAPAQAQPVQAQAAAPHQPHTQALTPALNQSATPSLNAQSSYSQAQPQHPSNGVHAYSQAPYAQSVSTYQQNYSQNSYPASTVTAGSTVYVSAATVPGSVVATAPVAATNAIQQRDVSSGNQVMGAQPVNGTTSPDNYPQPPVATSQAYQPSIQHATAPSQQVGGQYPSNQQVFQQYQYPGAPVVATPAVQSPPQSPQAVNGGNATQSSSLAQTSPAATAQAYGYPTPGVSPAPASNYYNTPASVAQSTAAAMPVTAQAIPLQAGSMQPAQAGSMQPVQAGSMQPVQVAPIQSFQGGTTPQNRDAPANFTAAPSPTPIAQPHVVSASSPSVTMPGVPITASTAIPVQHQAYPGGPIQTAQAPPAAAAGAASSFYGGAPPPHTVGAPPAVTAGQPGHLGTQPGGPGAPGATGDRGLVTDMLGHFIGGGKHGKAGAGGKAGKVGVAAIGGALVGGLIQHSLKKHSKSKHGGGHGAHGGTQYAATGADGGGYGYGTGYDDQVYYQNSTAAPVTDNTDDSGGWFSSFSGLSLGGSSGGGGGDQQYVDDSYDGGETYDDAEAALASQMMVNESIMSGFDTMDSANW